MAKFPAKPRGPGTFEQWGAIFFFIALFAVGRSCRSFGDAPPSYLGAEACAGCRARRVARRSFERGLEGCCEARDGADRDDAALVLSLLVASAKGAYDILSNRLEQASADIVLLDRELARYGPETKEPNHGAAPTYRVIASAAKQSCTAGVQRRDRHGTLRRLAMTPVGFTLRGSANLVED
jgi:hypothetical protein